jgi:hypothetical protein
MPSQTHFKTLALDISYQKLSINYQVCSDIAVPRESTILDLCAPTLHLYATRMLVIDHGPYTLSPQ